MNKSASITNLAKALVSFHQNMEKIPKDSSNPFFKSKYASLSTILEHIKGPLKSSGLIYTQFPGAGLTTILIHPESGEWMEAEYEIHPVKNDPQAIGSAITYARRYALAAILGLNIDEDDDGNAASEQPVGVITKVNGKTEYESLPWLNEGTKIFDGAVKKLSEGKTTIEKIKLAYRVSKVVETNLFRAAKMLNEQTVNN